MEPETAKQVDEAPSAAPPQHGLRPVVWISGLIVLIGGLLWVSTQ
jgi:hypothetical protein